jgi:MFS transporter, ACS family, solute carrier family 17 (sodium-dependent inorganic phosphate cotransporter), other
MVNRFHYTMLAWLPTYFTDTLSLNLTQAAQVQRVLRAAHHLGCRHKPSGWSQPGQARHAVRVCHRQVALAPPIAALVFSGIAGPVADALIDRGVDVERVRKISQCIAFLGPSALLTLASFTDSNWLAVGEDGACLRLSAPFALHVQYAVTPFCCPRVLVRDCR